MNIFVEALSCLTFLLFHDDPEVQTEDREKRKAIRRRGGQVLVWNYTEKLADFIAKRPDVFKKVK